MPEGRQATIWNGKMGGDSPVHCSGVRLGPMFSGDIRESENFRLLSEGSLG
jgi:hypothetical protein